MDRTTPTRTVTTVLFEGFELLDVFGPLEMFGSLPAEFALVLAGPATGPVASAQGVSAFADCAYADTPPSDILLIPGGIGTRQAINDEKFTEWLFNQAQSAEYVISVCTGSGLLAAAGLLDGYRATSNKQAFAWAREQSEQVEWIAQARWVEDRNRWTSSGVTAGMDMALGLIAHLHGSDSAQGVADRTEYEWRADPSWDPFAIKCGLVRSDPDSQ